MEKRGLSTTLRNLKFMERGVEREEKSKKDEEDVKPDGNFVSPGRKCVVVTEGDPHPGAVKEKLGDLKAQCSNADKMNCDGDLKRKQAEIVTEAHYPCKSLKKGRGDQHPLLNNTQGSCKQKHNRPDWNILRKSR